MPITPADAVARELAPLLNDCGDAGPRVGVAVSGGGDSMALLHLAVDWAHAQDAKAFAATVDHGLRAASATEAADVARVCGALGVPHVTLQWQGWNGQGNVQARARSARRQLLTQWADGAGLDTVLLGHTADDQAETFLMRLARGSGVDGLSGMEVGGGEGRFLRPLLGVSRATLRDWLTARGIRWIEDPSNDDLRFDRVKARQMLATLAPLGLTVDRLNDTAAHMRRARMTLWRAAADWSTRFVQADAGDLIFAPEALCLGHSDVEARVFSAAVQWIGRAEYRPRYDALSDAATALQRGEARTLGGVVMLPDGAKAARLTRELAATPGRAGADLTKTAIWDGRWQISHSAQDTTGDCGPWHIAALGEAGLAQCKDWRSAGLPRVSLLASPGIWAKSGLVAAPLAGFGTGWQAKLGQTFHQFILSH